MALNFLKTQFCKIIYWYEDTSYRITDYFDKIRFKDLGLEFDESDVLVWLSSFTKVKETYKKKFPVRNFVYKFIDISFSFPTYINYYRIKLFEFLFPKTIKTITYRIKTAPGSSERDFELTALFTLFEMFKHNFEKYYADIDDIEDYDPYSRAFILRTFELYQWWIIRRQKDQSSSEEDRLKVRELLEISKFI